MIASIALVAVAFFLQMVRVAPLVAQWAGILSILFFLLALALSVAGHRGFGPRAPKYWREREIEYSSPYPSLWDSLRTWWRRRRFRRL